MYNEQQKQEAGNIIWELINCGIQRGAYSSVEIAAIKQANHVITSPTPVDVPVAEEQGQKLDTKSEEQ